MATTPTDSSSTILQMIKEVGVPVAMLVWFAWRDKTQMAEFLAELKGIAVALAKLNASNEQVAKEVSGVHRVPPDLRRREGK
jgi:hypothetical protein